MGRFQRHCENLPKKQVFGNLALLNIAKNLVNEKASPNFQELTNEGLGEYPYKACQKKIFF